ncbi:TetR/AcrR family transcriptional regulator [Cohnella candidum]|uniref:TetR/AcrR family transcriptional regulator n=1 Tax=Cohnella candidum TaxID=2674991 RepID=A0A3G3K3C6_9BACL|nr:TetR/AcrR family transcriptional regulator [Cohnella candidum]AYQ74983.1 TetR/AcrR family transcriptional regulator [Cohnella candidum]
MNPALKRKIVEAAVPLFASQGYYKTTTAQIAESAGVTQPYLYLFFDTKERLYLAALDAAERRITDAVSASAAFPDDLLQGIEAEYRNDLRLILQSFAIAEPEIRTRTSSAFNAVYAAVTERFERQGSAVPDRAAQRLIGQAYIRLIARV